MPTFPVDWDSVNEERVVLEPGTYPAQLETRGLAAKVTSSGNQAIQVKFHVFKDGKDVLQITRTYPVEGNGLVFTKRLVKAAGLPAVGKTIFNSDSLHGRWVRVQIGHVTREFEEDGKIRTVIFHEVKEVLPYADGQGAPAAATATVNTEQAQQQQEMAGAVVLPQVNSQAANTLLQKMMQQAQAAQAQVPVQVDQEQAN